MTQRRNFPHSAFNSFFYFTSPSVSGLDQYVTSIALATLSYLYNCLQFVTKFLDDYSIPAEIDISDEAWKEFFTYVSQVHRYHSYIANFLKRVAQEYSESRRAVHYIFDILKLTMNDFLSGNLALICHVILIV